MTQQELFRTFGVLTLLGQGKVSNVQWVNQETGRIAQVSHDNYDDTFSFYLYDYEQDEPSYEQEGISGSQCEDFLIELSKEDYEINAIQYHTGKGIDTKKWGLDGL